MLLSQGGCDGGHVARTGDREMGIKFGSENLKRRGPLGTPNNRCEYNIRIDLRE